MRAGTHHHTGNVFLEQIALLDQGIGRVIAERTDIPAGVVNVVPAADHFVGEELTLSPKDRSAPLLADAELFS